MSSAQFQYRFETKLTKKSRYGQRKFLLKKIIFTAESPKKPV